jgi:hypothetical protein
MDHPSVLRPSLSPDQDCRLGLLHTRLPCERIPARVLGHNCLLRPVNGGDNVGRDSDLHPCRSRLDSLDWKCGGRVLCQQHLLVGSFGKEGLQRCRFEAEGVTLTLIPGPQHCLRCLDPGTTNPATTQSPTRKEKEDLPDHDVQRWPYVNPSPPSPQKQPTHTTKHSITIISIIRFSGLITYSTTTNPTCKSRPPPTITPPRHANNDNTH